MEHHSLDQWFPTGVQWRGAKGGVSYFILMKFWPISYLGVPPKTEIAH